MLGKRARTPLKRTTSMMEFTLDFYGGTEVFTYQPLDLHNPFNGGENQRSTASTAASTRPHHRNLPDFFETANFLRACSLCKRQLIPGRDIYMYRGDTAFCSLECRHQQMTQDERKEKCSVALEKETAADAGAQVSAAVETATAVSICEWK